MLFHLSNLLKLYCDTVIPKVLKLVTVLENLQLYATVYVMQGNPPKTPEQWFAVIEQPNIF